MTTEIYVVFAHFWEGADPVEAHFTFSAETRGVYDATYACELL